MVSPPRAEYQRAKGGHAVVDLCRECTGHVARDAFTRQTEAVPA